MRKSKFSEYQIVKILKSVEGGRTVVGVLDSTFAMPVNVGTGRGRRINCSGYTMLGGSSGTFAHL